MVGFFVASPLDSACTSTRHAGNFAQIYG